MALTRNRELRNEEASLTPDITAAYISVQPTWSHRWSAGWAGVRDGRRGIIPDPETGLTPYLQALAAHNATTVGSERLRTQAQIAPIDQTRAQWVERREQALHALDALVAEAENDTADSIDDVAVTRRARGQAARRQQLTDQIAAATEKISVLDEQRADRLTAGALRIQRCTQRTQHLVARYWRSYARHHPELPELRQVYTVPAITVPPHPFGL